MSLLEMLEYLSATKLKFICIGMAGLWGDELSIL